jgi:hypothetical protein
LIGPLAPPPEIEVVAEDRLPSFGKPIGKGGQIHVGAANDGYLRSMTHESFSFL